MKTINKVLISIASLSLLAGCSSTVTTHVSNGSDVYFTVGKTTVTKSDVYTYMKLQNLASGIIGMAENDLASSLVEVTDEMNNTVDERIAADKELYGEETFKTMLSYYGFADEDDYRSQYILNMQMTQLTQDYIEDNWDDLMEKYTPVKAVLLSFVDSSEDTTSEDDSSEVDAEDSEETSETEQSQAELNANQALADLQSGDKDIATVIEEYSLSDSSEASIYTSESDIAGSLLTYMTTNQPGYSSVIYDDSTGTPTYYIVYIESNDPTEFKDEVLTTLSSNDDVATAADQYLLRSHGFTVYDDMILSGLQESYNGYLSDSQQADTTSDSE